jgi:sporulation protein YlmC with PRC-barrel domain
LEEIEMKGICLIHDVLDEQLLDRTKKKMGRVDGLVLELRDNEPPRVVELLVGGSIAAERVGGWMTAIVRGCSRLLRIEPAITRIPFDAVQAIGPCVEVDVDARSTDAMRTEAWLDDHFACRIPGGGGKERK